MGQHPPEKKKMHHPADPVKMGDTVYVKKVPDVLVEVKIEEVSPEEIHCGRVINVLGNESEEIFIDAAVCFPKDYIDTISCSD